MIKFITTMYDEITLKVFKNCTEWNSELHNEPHLILTD